MIIRFVLLSGLALIGYYVIRRREALPVHAFLILLPLGLAALAVIFPDATTWVAKRAGVARGVDLINYLVELALLFIVLHYYAKFTELESQMTVLVRELALRKAADDPAGHSGGPAGQGDRLQPAG